MIFVTLGTQANGFLRCLREVEKIIDYYHINEEVVAQIGNTHFYTDKFTTFRFTNEIEFIEYIRKASVIITHAGSGAIFNSIKFNKKVIAMARLHHFNEMVDNHQIELVRKLADSGYIIDGTYSLVEVWHKIDDFIPRRNDFYCDIVKVLGKDISKWLLE